MAQKFLRLSAGKIKELEATVATAGAGDAGKIPALDAGGKLDVNMMPTGVGPQTKSFVTSENLAAGNLVNIWDDGGTPKARKADATTTGKEANGFVLAGTTSPAAATVYFNGTLSGLSGLTGGADYFLGTTAGGIVLAASVPSSAGNVVQPVGRALSATELAFNPLDAIELV